MKVLDNIGKSITGIKSLLPPKVPRHTEKDKELLRRNAVASVMARSLVLTVALIVGLSGPVAAMTTEDVVMHFWGGGDDWPTGTVYLTDSDGAYITDSDGAYITF